jgi:hypothetical protein
MDKVKYPRLWDAELVIGLSRRGAIVAARGWLAVLLVATAAAAGLMLMIQRII